MKPSDPSSCEEERPETLQSPKEVGPEKTGGPKAVGPQPKSLTSSQPATISIKKDVQKDPSSELLL